MINQNTHSILSEATIHSGLQDDLIKDETTFGTVLSALPDSGMINLENQLNSKVIEPEFINSATGSDSLTTQSYYPFDAVSPREIRFSFGESLTVVDITIDWSFYTGYSSTSFSYGLNLFQGFNPNVVSATIGSSVYRDNIESMNPGIIRYHRYEQMLDAQQNLNGWVISPDTEAYRWDRDKIALALDADFEHNPTVMMNIANWPYYMSLANTLPNQIPGVPDEISIQTGKLRLDMIDAYAEFCAELVHIINIEQGHGMQYWEILNEMDQIYTTPEAMAELAEIYVRAAMAMKAVDPTIRVGGPAFTWPDRPQLVRPFLEIAHPYLDFVSYHSFSSGSIDDSNEWIWDRASEMGRYTQIIQALLAEFTDRPIETFHNEFNISYDPPDQRMETAVGAVYDALALAAIARSGATGAMAWAESDGWYGKMNLGGDWERRPSSYVFEIYNNLMQGDIVASSSSASSAVEVFAIDGDFWEAFSLVNRSGQEQMVNLNLFGGDYLSNSQDMAKVYQIGEDGLIWGLATLSQLTTTPFTLPTDTITVIELTT